MYEEKYQNCQQIPQIATTITQNDNNNNAREKTE